MLRTEMMVMMTGTVVKYRILRFVGLTFERNDNSTWGGILVMGDFLDI